MSNLNSDPLHSLIHSLGKAEKRHFKVFASRHVIGACNNYVKLFDAIEGHKHYDEAHLKKQESFKNFRSIKNRLLNTVLRSLESYHSSVEMEIKSLMNQAEILYNKSLTAHSHKQIQKAKILARQYELTELLLEALRLELRIGVKKLDHQFLKEVLQEEKDVIALLENQKVYRDLAMDFSILFNKYGSQRNSKGLQHMGKMIRHPYLKDGSKAVSLRSLRSYTDCHCFYALVRGDFKTIYRLSKKMLDAYHANPDQLYFNSLPYLAMLNNFLIAVQGLRKFEKMKMYIGKLNAIRKNMRTMQEKADAFFYMYHFMNYYILTGLFSESREDILQIEKEMPEHEKNLNQHQKTMLYLCIAQVYFGQAKYKLCLHWLNRVTQLGEMDSRKDIDCFIRIFYLILHYEMKSDLDFTVSLFKSTYRFLYKRERLYKFETEVMHFIRKNLLKRLSAEEMHLQFINLRSKLTRLAEDPYEKHALDYFDFISWLESKIQGRSFAEVVSGKAGVIGQNNFG